MYGFLSENNAIALRYSTNVDSAEGLLSYHAVYDEPDYDFDLLGKWARKNVRRGLKNCQVEPIPLHYLADHGWQLQADTLDRQGRKIPISPLAWRRLCLSAENLPGFEAWGAFAERRLAASVITFQMKDCGYMLYQQCHREYLSAHVNNALGFEVTKNMIGRPGIKSILYGLHSLDAPASVDEFKFRMGYKPKPVRQRVMFHPFLRPFMTPTSHRLVKILLQRNPGSPFWAKTEGMIRFYLEGLKPLEEQTWPACLEDKKEEILADGL